MARLFRLTENDVRRSGEGMHCDGGGLYLQVTSAGRSWIFRYATSAAERDRGLGRERQMGLGSVHSLALERRSRLKATTASNWKLSLEEARELAAEGRRQRQAGVDPIEARNAKRAAERAEAQLQAQRNAAEQMTFDRCADQYIAENEAGWRNPKHRAQWYSTLRTYASPVFGRVPVDKIDLELIEAALRPIWNEKPETASRVRGRIESVLDWATVKRYRRGDNPARWRGNLEHLFQPRTKLRPTKHHPALPFREIGDFMRELRSRDGVAARALELVILTATRSSEVLGAKWPEIDLQQRVWTIPAERMKAKRDHRVPLSAPALALLQSLPREGEHVFIGNEGEPLSENSMLALLERMGHGDITVHGFRSTFRDWGAELTSFANEMLEIALAHKVSDKAEAAYRRGDLFQKRRKLMDAWAAYSSKPSVASKNNVVPLRTTTELSA